MSAAPLVTVGLSAYNAGAALTAAIQSVLRQTYDNWELILIDDGSTDDTLATMRRFEGDRVRVIADGTNRGVAARFNQAFDLGKGRYFARMDQDDIAYPGRLEAQVNFLERHSDIDLVGTRALVFRNDGSVIGLYPFRRTHAEICAKPWLGFYFAQPTWMGKMEWFRRHRYRIPEVVRAEDQDLLLRSYRTSRFACLPEVLLGYRQTELPLRKVLTARKHLALAQWSVNLEQGHPGHAALGFLVFSLK
ncbi:MAG: glycosyltransferase family 2 protein, partial [Betaproteobacteria bacterium]|nr:glycosyltransferase family 2 protein [Betaproteobacteria bacterium]